MPSPRRALRDADYARLLAVRTALRRFERWSADQAGARGITSSQHQLLLALRGHPEPQGPTIGQVAEYLLVRHHSAVELADRTARAGLIRRVADEDDLRVVRLQLTDEGEAVLRAVSESNLAELEQLTALLDSLIGALAEAD